MAKKTSIFIIPGVSMSGRHRCMDIRSEQASVSVYPCAATQRGGCMSDRAFRAEHRRCLAEYSICRKRLKRIERNGSLAGEEVAVGEEVTEGEVADWLQRAVRLPTLTQERE